MGMAHTNGIGNLLGGSYPSNNIANNSLAQAQPYGAQGGAYNNAYAAQQQLLYSQHQQSAYTKPNWVWDGKECSIEEFANQAFGDDTPEKTMFLLRYAGKDKK